jgi:hypothetical protein
MNSTFRRQPTETDLPSPGCQQAITAAVWAAGELDLDAQRVYRAHLAHCPFCAAEQEAFRKTVAQLRAGMSDVEPSPDLTDRIMAALPSDAFRVTPFTRVLSFASRHRHQVAAAAAAVVMAVGGLGVWQYGTRTPVDTGPAAQAGCAWIARQQAADGSWDPVKGGGSARYRPALTALASLALLRERDRYSREIAAACTALLRVQDPDGAFGADESGRMYNHALATWALLAAYDSGRRPELKSALDKAVAFIRARQQATGGWGYLASAGEPANTAVTAWQVQVLARAQWAGWGDAGGQLRKGLNWLRQRASDQGQFGYTASRGDASATPTLNAMGAYTLLTCGGARPELVRVATTALAHLRTDPQAGAAPETDFYRAFFTVAAWEAAGDRQRADRMRAVVCDRREIRGADKGSWAPTDDWSKVGGRLYATSLAVLTLQSRAGKTL